MIPSMPDSPPLSQSPSTPSAKTANLAKQNLSSDFERYGQTNPILSEAKEGSRKTSPPPSPKIRSKKGRVTFNKVVHNRRIPHLNDMSEAEILETWIQPEDYLEIRSKCIATVQKMMRGALTQEDLDNEVHCPRGLEGKTREGNTRRRENKVDSIAAVLEEQALQWNEDVFDEEAIMEVYTYYTIPCSEMAYAVALEDAETAQTYLHSKECATSNNTEYLESEMSTPCSPVATLATGVVNRLKDILFHRANKAAILQDVESFVYNESAMERRRKVYEKPSGNVLASQLKQYFLTQGRWSSSSKLTEEQDIPSLASSQYTESAEVEDDDSSSSSHADSYDSHGASCENFTTRLQYHFYSRKRRQALLDSIEQGFFDENETSIVTFGGSASLAASMATSNVVSLSSSVGSILHDFFAVQSNRKAVVDQLRASSHLRR